MCKRLTTITIPNRVTSIGEKAFQHCEGLTSVTIGNGVTSIGKETFGYCKNLNSITIGNGVTSIGEGAFRNCTDLTSVTIGNGVESIGEYAFSGCSGLTSIACYAKDVPTTGAGVFSYIDEPGDITLYVPSSSVGAYGGTVPWSDFDVKPGQVEVEGIYYQLNPVGNVAEVIKNPSGDYYTGEIVIRSKITCYEKEWSVTSIGDEAFLGCENMTSVTIPSSVTSIGSMAFGYCRGLTSVTVPSSVKSIGDKAFHTCTGLTSVTINSGSIGDDAFYGCTSLKYVTLGNGVTSIGNRTFYECTRLISISIPNSVTSIGNIAFYNSGLTSVTIGSGVKSIGMYAFSCCADLTSITIGSGVTSIGHGVFNDCTSLTSIVCNAKDVPETGQNGQNAFYGITQSNVTLYVPSSSVEAYKAAEPWKNFKDVLAGQVEVDGIYYQLHPAENEAEVIKKPSGYYEGDIEIPSDFTHYDTYWFVTSIGDDAFNGCTGLTSVTIPDGVMSIGEYAFNGCGGLTSITLPNRVISIGEGAFFGCNGLTSIAIPNSVKSIEKVAFAWCTGLTSIVCNAESVPGTSSDAFFGITQSNVTLYVPSSSVDAYKAAEPWKNFKDVLAVQVEFDGIYYQLHPDKHEAEVIKHPDGYEGDIVIPSTITYPAEGEEWSVTSIGEQAFLGCEEMTSIAIPNSVTSIGGGAFVSCGLTSIVIPNSVTSIGEQAFYGCTDLAAVTIGNGVTSMGSHAFSESGLTSVTIGNGVTSIGDYAFQYCSGLTSIDIPNSVTSIGENAFDNCKGLASVTIGNSVTSIGNAAFNDCSALTSIDIPNSVTIIGGGAFYNCIGLTSVTIGNGVESIGNNAFLGCKGLTSIAIPNSVTSIGEGAFSNCSGLTSITIGNSVTSIGDYAFNNCTELTSVAIPNSVESIGSNAFYNCTSLTTVTIGNSVTSIGGNAFSYCGLTSIDIPNSVTSIGEYAFFYCTSLTSVTIGNSVESIGSRAFGLCKGLTSIACYAEDVPETGSDTFEEIDQSKVTLSVPYSSVEAYKATEPWSGFNIVALAVEIDIDGIYYSLNPETHEAEVIKHPKGYKDDVDIPSTVVFDGEEYPVTSIAGFAFSDCKDLTSVTIPEGVTSIGNLAFYGCTGLTGIDIPEGVTSIEWSTFSGCTALTGITLPNSVTSIEDYAFYGCTSLKEVTIGTGIQDIGNKAFTKCESLLNVYCYAESVPETNYFAFDESDQGSITLYVPGSSVDAYKAKYPWRSFKEVLPIESLEPETFMATITEAGWATLFLPFAASVPEGVTAYTITDVENGALVKEEVTGVIPSNTGVLLKGDAGEYVFEEAEEPEPIEANLLIGTAADEGETFNEPGYKYYILANDAENGIGFYFQKDTNGKSAFCGQYKAVLVLPEKTDAIGFRLDGATVIETVEAPADDAVIYDLTGRRVQDAAGGIYIVNGKKVLVK